MDKKLKIFGVVTSIITAMYFGIVYGHFLEEVMAEKETNEILNLKNKMLLFVKEKIEGSENSGGGSGTYKINEDGSVTFIESAESAPFPKWLEELCNEDKNCAIVTANDSLLKNVRGKYGGYAVGKKPKILKISNITVFNETEIK